jgi:hypothetical protein
LNKTAEQFTRLIEAIEDFVIKKIKNYIVSKYKKQNLVFRIYALFQIRTTGKTLIELSFYAPLTPSAAFQKF